MTTTQNLTTLEHVLWPTAGEHELPNLPGFIASPFGPLIAHVADLCLIRHYGEPPAPPERGLWTAFVLVTRLGDMATEAAIVQSVDLGTKASPLLFYQSVPTAVLGVVAARWGFGGPVIGISPVADARAEGLDLAELLIEDGSARDVLLVLVDLATSEGQPDIAEALLVRAAEPHEGEKR
ncbi:beta-ketoacyl synthase chain length factor [Streptomyces bobili]|uniref:beta-ketoacyl synthase chain length factor n=1 Tax=Streptomyces bobili TaxID=67280 RepID=UPI00343753D6